MRALIPLAAATLTTVLSAVPAGAVVLSGVFTPQPIYDTLQLAYGALDTSGNGNGYIGTGLYRVSFTLGAPADFDLSLYQVEVFDEYDADGSYLGGDEMPGLQFQRLGTGTTGSGRLKILRPFSVPNGSGGVIETYFFGAAVLDARFSTFGSPIAYEFHIDRIGNVPEPASWTGFIIGFGLIGAALRYRRPGAPVPRGWNPTNAS